jgi:hypothetical protein
MLYADAPARRFRQVVGDLFIVAWVWFWVWLSMKLYHLVEKLAVPGQKLASAGDGISSNLATAGSKVGSVPVAGKDLASPLNQAANAAKSIADAGREQQTVVHQMSWALALLLLAMPMAVVLFIWLPLRLRWIRRAGVASSLRRGSAGQDLLALRALTNQPLRRLSTVDEDPVGAWRRGDAATVTALARLELRQLGLRPAKTG